LLLFYTISVALTAAVLILGFQTLLVRQGRRVPVKATTLALAGVTACALLAGFVLTNIAANTEAVQSRGSMALGSVYLAANLDAAGEPRVPDPQSPASDIWSASIALMSEPASLRDIGSGKTVDLRTLSGRPAMIRLIDAGQGEAEAVVTYDGADLDLSVPGPFPSGSMAYNDSGYPQLIPTSALPTRS
jgi:hypothetical protein